MTALVPTVIPTVQLNDGKSMPVLAYGTDWERPKDGGIDLKLVKSLKEAFKLGYYHIDGAEMYETEEEIGLAIRQTIRESGQSREKFFVTTKVLGTIADIPRAIKQSLEKLQLEYVDMYLIHSPFFTEDKSELQKAWAEMEKVKEAGQALSIGVSNFLESHLHTILETAKICPAVNQTEYHPYLQRGNLIPFQENLGIKTIGYRTLAPIGYASGGLIDALLSTLAKKYGVSEAEILFRWVLDHGGAIVTKTANKSRMESYLKAFSFKLSQEEVNEISRVGQKEHVRTCIEDKFAKDDRS